METIKITKVWMYYTTDGDSGYYRIKLFKTHKNCKAYYDKQDSGYKHMDEIEVNE